MFGVVAYLYFRHDKMINYFPHTTHYMRMMRKFIKTHDSDIMNK